MNLDVLKTFCDLVDSGNFSKAAELNLISQSAVSQQLAALEREVGTPLVERSQRPLRTTPAGASLRRLSATRAPITTTSPSTSGGEVG